MKPPTARKISAWLIVITLVVWVVWDIVAVAVGGAYATESAVIRDWATQHPSLAFGVGTVAGHWFWNVKKIRYPKLMYVAFAVLVLFFVLDFVGDKIPPMFPLFPFVGGMITGRLLWPMGRIKEGKK